MTQETFLKLTGKSFKLTSDGQFEFQASTVECLKEVRAWFCLGHAAATERNGYRFHIVYAGNGTYFKYDGPGSEDRCINFFIEDIGSNECWMQGCLIYRGAKQAKETIRRYRDMALNLTVEEIEATRAKEREMYSYRYKSIKELTEQ